MIARADWTPKFYRDVNNHPHYFNHPRLLAAFDAYLTVENIYQLFWVSDESDIQLFPTERHGSKLLKGNFVDWMESWDKLPIGIANAIIQKV
jgi:hypothetical protein